MGHSTHADGIAGKVLCGRFKAGRGVCGIDYLWRGSKAPLSQFDVRVRGGNLSAECIPSHPIPSTPKPLATPFHHLTNNHSLFRMILNKPLGGLLFQAGRLDMKKPPAFGEGLEG